MPVGQIFFSYSRVDAEFALKLGEDLRKAGVDIWIDQIDIRPSEPWDEEIEIALQSSGCLLVILSDTSVASDNVLNEINYAIESKKQILPILLEKNIKKPININRLQHIDFTGSYETGLHMLLKSLNLEAPIPVIKKSRYGKVVRIAIVTATIVVLIALLIVNLIKPGSARVSTTPKTEEPSSAKKYSFQLTGKWSTNELTNPFDNHDKYKIYFDLETQGNVIVGSINMRSTVDWRDYNIKKNFLGGSIKDSIISFYTAEQSIMGNETINYKNFYSGIVSKDEIKFTLQSDRPMGFPGQQFVAVKSKP